MRVFGILVWLEFSPQTGHEQAGRRPALVLSPQAYNAKVGHLIGCPITSKSKGYSFEVALPNDVVMAGVILADQVKTLDWKARKAVFIVRLPDAVVQNVMAKLNTLLT